MKRVGIVGSREYTNRRKKFAIEFDMKYVEFPPRHYTYNQHCILDESHYGKRYFPKNFIDRNKQIVEYSDYIVAFMNKGEYTKTEDFYET